MWYLISESDKRVIYVLPDNSIVIGRSVDALNCNFAVPDDPSISRKHAALLISQDALYLKDLGSKYGSFVNNSEKVEQDVMIKLNSDDIVKFGKMGCVWKVQAVNLVTCTSTLKGENLRNLNNLLTKLGGTVKSEWDDTCAFLTMPAITLTIKVVLALVQNSHVVTVKYWTKCLEAITNNNALPNASEFTPEVLESTLNRQNVSFLPNERRSSIFAGKKIIFFSRRQMEMYKMVLLKSSATVLLLSETKLTKSALCNENVIIIQFNLTSVNQETQAQKDQIIEITNYLKGKGKRIVADAEIGLAILYCSTEKYCNPDFNFPSEVIKQLPNQNVAINVLAQESQELLHSKFKKESVFIDESLTPKQSASNITGDESTFASKRKLSEDEANDTDRLSKKQAIGTTTAQENNTSKRPGGDINDLETLPSKRVALENDDGDNIFNFVKPAAKQTIEGNQNNKLNLSKPLKRKHSAEMDEDDLFNFVDKGNKKPATDKTSSDTLESFDEFENAEPANKTRVVSDNKINIKELRGSKLDELMRNNAGMSYKENIKKEDVSELDLKFSNIDLGSTTLVVKADLIVKREPLQLLSPQGGVKNFKTFKKVWPVNMQKMILKSSLAITDINSNAGTEIAVNS